MTPRDLGLVLTLLAALALCACGGGTAIEFETDDAADDGASIPPFLVPDWVTQEGESDSDVWGKNVAALPTSGDAIMAGGFIDSVTLDPNGANEKALTGAGMVDAFVARYDTDGACQWAQGIFATGYVDLGEIATTSDDEITVVGYFDGELTLAEGTAEETSLDAAGFEDSFVARYDEDGVLQWSAHVESTEIVEILAVGGLSDDGVVVGGLFAGSITLAPGEIDETTLTADGVLDAFLAFYDADGDFVSVLHTKSDATTDYVTVWSIDVADDDTFAVTGDFLGTVDIAGGAVLDEQISSDGDSQDGYLAVYDSDGDLSWVRTLGGESTDSVYAVDIAPDGGVICVTGDFRETATWESDTAANDVSMTSEGGLDASLAVYDSDGKIDWVRQVGGLEDDFGYDVLVNDDGEVLLLGYFTDEATFSGGGNEATLETDGTGDADGYLAAFASDGTIAWLRTEGGTGDDYALALELVPGTDNDIYTVGSFVGDAYLWQDETSHTSRGDIDAFIAILIPE